MPNFEVETEFDTVNLPRKPQPSTREYHATLKRTGWNNGTSMPENKGLYERKFSTSGQVVYAWWTGEHWCYSSGDITMALYNRRSGPSTIQLQPCASQWRGVVKYHAPNLLLGYDVCTRA
jgi:hypothetical protein